MNGLIPEIEEIPEITEIPYGMDAAIEKALWAISEGVEPEQAIRVAAAVHVVCPAELWREIALKL